MYFKVMKSETGDTRHHRHTDTKWERDKNAWDLFKSPIYKKEDTDKSGDD